jgi:hypothetical protein
MFIPRTSSKYHRYKSGQHDLIGPKSRTKICGIAGKVHTWVVPILFLIEVFVYAGVLNVIPPIIAPYVRKETDHPEVGVIAGMIGIIGIGMQFMLHYTGFLDYEPPLLDEQPHCRCEDTPNQDVPGTWNKVLDHHADVFCAECNEGFCHKYAKYHATMKHTREHKVHHIHQGEAHNPATVEERSLVSASSSPPLPRASSSEPILAAEMHRRSIIGTQPDCECIICRCCGPPGACAQCLWSGKSCHS